MAKKKEGFQTGEIESISETVEVNLPINKPWFENIPVPSPVTSSKPEIVKPWHEDIPIMKAQVIEQTGPVRKKPFEE